MRCYSQRLTMSLAAVVSLFTVLPAMAEPESESDGWKFGGSVYLWGAGVKGTDADGDEIDVSFTDILKDLDGGLMGGIAARNGKWTLLADLIYLSIHQETSSTVNIAGSSVKTDVDAKLKGYVSTFGAAYRIIEEEDVTLDLLGGGRYFQLDLDLDAEIGGSESKSSDSYYVLDGIVGAQVLYNLNEKWYVSCYADVGTGDSELTWQVWPGVGYRLDSVDLVAGYRHLAWETDDGESIDDISFSGPMIGLKFNF